jgi:hypothetical protein
MHSIFGIDDFYKIKIYKNNKLLNESDIAIWPNGWDLHTTLKKHNIIKINKSELNQYEDYSEILLNGEHSFYSSNFFNPSIGNFIRYDLLELYKSTSELINTNSNFYYLINDCSDFFNFYKECILPEHIIQYIKLNKCKILLNASYEPYSSNLKEYYQSITNFARKYKLTKDNFYILTGNLIAQNNEKYKFKFIPYLYFLDFLIFDNKFDKNFKEKSKFNLNKLININRNIKFDKKILCYQKRNHIHRNAFYYEITNSEIINNNIFISLWREYTNFQFDYKIIGYSQNESDLINLFLKENTSNKVFDDRNIIDNLGIDFDINFHKKTFMSVVSESRVESDLIFFSEKVFKPINALQPFVLISSQNSLNKLKEFGFKTFDKWWDESYDSANTTKERIEKIKKILIDICNKSDDELQIMLIEMEDILVHNYKILNDTNFNNFNNLIDELLTCNWG